MVEVIGFAFSKYKIVAKRTAYFAMEYLNIDADLTIKFVSPKEIRRLNKTFRNIDKVTDVLSFPALDNDQLKNISAGEYLGDMAICLAQAKKQGKQYSGVMAEIKKLTIHSILHLLGYDHITDQDYVIMQQKEEQISNYITEKYGF